MKFEGLELENFASYYGKHKIDLSCTEEKPVVIVIGGTGFGKTTLFDALNWALYGVRYEEQIVKTRQRNILDYVNERALGEALAKGEFVSTSCTLYFEHESLHYYITQEMMTKATKTPNNKLDCHRSDRTTALYKITATGNHEKMKYDEIFLDELLPNNVKDYFLFDGDRIYQLSNPGARKEVRDAIYRVVDLEILDKSIKHFRDVEKDFRRQAKQESTDELRTVNEAYEEAEETLSGLKKTQNNYDEELIALKEQIQIIENSLLDLPDTRGLQAQRNEINRQMIEVEERDKENALKIRSHLVPVALGLASGSAGLLLQELESQRKKGAIPQKVSVKLLEDLLSAGKCLCGTQLKSGSEAFERIQKRLQEEQNRDSGEALLELLYKLVGTNREIQKAKDELKEFVDLHDDNLEAIREMDLILKQIDTQLDSMPKKDINAIRLELKNMNSDKEELIRKIERGKINIEKQQKMILELSAKRERLGQKQRKALKLQQRENLAKRAADRLEFLYEAFAEESRKSIEEHTLKEFQNFVRSSSAYDVRLTHDYELEVLDSLGNPALSRLSMGQSQCLSLSFITSIAKVSEKNPPLVIDMPLGRLDRDVHEQISKRLPELASQLILFLIPEIEWNEVTSGILANKASHIFKLAFDDKTRETTIEKVS